MAPDRPVASASPGRVRTARVLFVLGLVIVAALSSLVWWSIRSDPDETRFSSADRPSSSGGAADDSGGGPGRPPVLRAGRFTYRALAPLDVRQRCDDVSYGKVREWFAERPCREVIRGLFDVRADGARAAVAVSVVTMPSRSQARALKKLTDTDGTGNVSDLIRDGTVSRPGLPQVAGGKYASKTSGPRLTIVEAAFFGDTRNAALLDQITTQALRLEPKMRARR